MQYSVCNIWIVNNNIYIYINTSVWNSIKYIYLKWRTNSKWSKYFKYNLTHYLVINTQILKWKNIWEMFPNGIVSLKGPNHEL